MHALFFGMKRAFHATLRLTRRGLTRIGLTAARFDLLYLLKRRVVGGTPYPVLQSAIWKELGVTPPVVSRMLGSLEELGLVERERAPSDRRQRLVTLTQAGLARIREGMRRFMYSGYATLALESALAGERWTDRDACFWALCDFESPIDRVRKAFGDTGTLSYPWHPDD